MKTYASFVVALLGTLFFAAEVAAETENTSIQTPFPLRTVAASAKVQEFVGVTHDIGDFETPINGYVYKEYWGKWTSRASGKQYMIGIANLPHAKNPGAIFLEEVKEKRPGQSVYGIERMVTIRAVAFVKKSKKSLKIDGDFCAANKHIFELPYTSIIAALSPANEKIPREEIYGGSGIDVVAHQAWFLNVENETLTPLSENQMKNIVCKDRKW